METMENKDLSKGAGAVAQSGVFLKSRDSVSRRNWFVLSLLLLAAIIGFGFVCLLTGKSLEGVSLIVGCLITKLGTLIDFMYGSSQGSKDKDRSLSLPDGRQARPSPNLPDGQTGEGGVA